MTNARTLEKIADEFASAMVCADDFSQTRETIDDFVEASKKWAQLQNMERKTIDGCDCALFRGAQAFKGHPKVDVLVISPGGEKSFVINL